MPAADDPAATLARTMLLVPRREAGDGTLLARVKATEKVWWGELFPVDK